MTAPHRWPCTPYCAPDGPCAAECELPPPEPLDVDPEAAAALFDLAIQLQEALGEQCHGHIRMPSGGGLRCRRVTGHPLGRGLLADVPTTQHAYGGFESDPDLLRTWTDADMGATSHREWWALHGEGETRRQRIKDRGREAR